MKRKSNLLILVLLLALGLFPQTPLCQEILVWDNDAGSDFLDPDGYTYVGCEYGITQALEANEHDYEVLQYLPSDLSQYEVIFVTLGIWCIGCGATPPGAVGSVEQQNLVSFLEEGKSLYIEGVDWAKNLNGTALFDFFGAEFIDDGNQASLETITGVQNTFCNPYEFEYITSEDPNYMVDEIAAAGGTLLTTSVNGEGRSVANTAANDARAIGSSFVFGAMADGEDPNLKAELMQSYMMFLTRQDYPITWLSADNIDMGNTYQGFPVTYNLEIQNLGITQLEITDIQLSGEQFSYQAPQPLSLQPGDSDSIEISFAAQQTGDFTSTLTFTTNEPGNNSYSIPITTSCLLPPEIQLPQSSLDVELTPNETTTESFVIDNNGDSVLNFELEFEDTTTKGSGGPDEFGYQWIDSDAAGGPAYSWIEINQLGTDTGLSGDEGVQTLALPFDFSFYGNSYSNVTVYANGYITFGEQSSYYNNTFIPKNSQPNNMIAAFWDDLHQKNGTCYSYYQEEENRFIIEYENWGFYANEGPLTFQIVLNQNGQIYLNYKELNWNLDSCTVGIEDSTGDDGLQVAFNEEYLHDQMSICFATGPIWLFNDIAAGSIQAGGSANVELTFNSGSLANGEYSANMLIYSNDPDEAVLEVPINLTVSGTANQNNIPEAATKLMANYPNPFNPQTAISFSLAETENVKLEIYNTKGQLVRTVVNEELPKGQHSYVWQGKDGKGNHVASGIYFYKLSTPSYTNTRKMMLLK